MISLPLLHWMVSRGVRVSLAVLVTVLGVFGILSALGFLISGTINQFAQAAPGYLEQLVANLRQALQALESRDIPVSDWLTLERLDAQSLVNLAGGILGLVCGFALAVYCSVEWRPLSAGGKKPPSWCRSMANRRC